MMHFWVIDVGGTRQVFYGVDPGPLRLAGPFDTADEASAWLEQNSPSSGGGS